MLITWNIYNNQRAYPVVQNSVSLGNDTVCTVLTLPRKGSDTAAFYFAYIFGLNNLETYLSRWRVSCATSATSLVIRIGQST